MKTGYEFLARPFNDRGLERLIELTETTYPGSDIANPEYLNWEYFQNPGGPALISIVEKEGKIISQYVVLPGSYSINNKLVNGSLSVNTLTHPGYRGLGLFEKLAGETFNRCRENNILFTIGFPNPVSHPVIKKKNIFDTVGFLPFLFRPINPIGSVFRYFRNRNQKSGSEIELNTIGSISQSATFISKLDLKADSEKYEKFVQEFNSQKQNVTNRSLQFLNWRFLQNPKRKYLILKLDKENRIQSLVVVRAKYVYGLRCGIVIDLMTITPGVDSLLKSIQNIFFSCTEKDVSKRPSSLEVLNLFRQLGFQLTAK